MAAISSPLLETSINGARGVIINVTASSDIGLEEVDNAAQLIHKAVHPDVNLIWGVALDDSLQDEMKVTVIATGFDTVPDTAAAASDPLSNLSSFGGSKSDASDSGKDDSYIDDIDDIIRLFDKK